MRALAFLASTLALAALAACSSNHGTTTTNGTGGAGAAGATGTGGSILVTTTGSGAGGESLEGGVVYPIYADTDTDLYTLDPSDPTLTLTHLGAFDCVGPSGSPGQQTTSMTDVAVDMSQDIWALSSYAVREVTVMGTTVHCAPEIEVHVPDPACSTNPPGPSCTDPSFPYIKFEALTFAPIGTISPTEEVLVAGDTAGELWTINTVSDAIEEHGTFGTVPADDGRGHSYPSGNVGKAFELSGDIVFLANNGKPVGFATVRDCPNPPDNSGCNTVDTLIEIDMTQIATMGAQSVRKGILGQVVRNTSTCGDTSAGYGSMYGIASWSSVVYGFSNGGQLVSVDNVDGSACLVKDYSPLTFAGAAVTTIAPVVPPPPPPVM